jgi:hypothetical protein
MFRLNCFQFCSIEDQSMLSSSPLFRMRHRRQPQ